MSRTKIILYIAQSIDGYIAADDGSVDFLSCVETEGEDYGYFDFYNSIDAVIMGANTYEQILGFGEFPYPDKPCYVFTSKKYEPHDHVEFIDEKPEKWVKSNTQYNDNEHKRLWLVGGANLVKGFQDDGLIDEFIISVIPMMLGSGIPLFMSHQSPIEMKLKNVKTYATGLVQLVYEKYGKE